MAYYERSYRFGFGGGMTTAVKYLLIINGVVYLFQRLIGYSVIDWFGLHPQSVLGEFHIWQLFTYMFLHSQGDPFHIIFNLFILWMFGCEVERGLGTRGFVKYYLICGVGAGLVHLLVYFNSPIPVVGASGAIYGVMMAFGVLYPERVITLLLLFVIPVQLKAKYLVMIFAGISLFLGVFGDSGVAHFAHLGGMLVGFAYLKLDWRMDYLGNWIRQQRESRVALQKLKKQQDMRQFRERVDEILDKINEVGFDKLSEEEKRILQDASQQFSQEPEKDT